MGYESRMSFAICHEYFICPCRTIGCGTRADEIFYGQMTLIRNNSVADRLPVKVFRLCQFSEGLISALSTAPLETPQ
jgi:hypothetical protein